MTSSFRASAEQRIGELEHRDQERHARTHPADGEVRARLAQRFGQEVANRVDPRSEYRLFTVGIRNVAVAYARPAEAHHPGGRAPRPTPTTAPRSRGASWDHQLALQRALGVGVNPPVIVYGNELADAAADVARLLIDPSDTDLRSCA